MEGNLVRKHQGIKWFQAKRVTNKARARLGNNADESAVFAESCKLIKKGMLAPNYFSSDASSVDDVDDDDDDSFDVRVTDGPLPREAWKHAPSNEKETNPTEMEMLAGFFLDFGSCQCVDREEIPSEILDAHSRARMYANTLV